MPNTLRITTLLCLFLSLSKANAVPSFARQTGLSCNVCHKSPPELTPFGRNFKLRGYVLSSATDKDEVNAAIKRASEQQLKGILTYTTAPNVSIDFNHDPHSSIFHMDQTKVMDGTFVRVMAWYDNEWGFSMRMADTAVAMGKLG